jgi:hypothetical protein
LLVILTFLPGVSSTNAPNACKYKDVFKSFNFLFVKDIFKKFTHAHDHTNIYLWNNVLETLGAME